MINTFKTTELKEMAKDAKVKNWWNLKKAELIEELYKDPHYGLIFDYMEDYEVPFEIAQDMVSGGEEADVPIVTIVNEIETEMPIEEVEPNIELEDKQQEDEEPIMILSEFAYMFNFKTTKTRRILRDHNITKNGGRWEWFKGDEKVIEEIKEVLEKYAK